MVRHLIELFDLAVPNLFAGIVAVLFGLLLLLAIFWGVSVSRQVSPKRPTLTAPDRFDMAESSGIGQSLSIAQTVIAPYWVWLSGVLLAMTLDLVVLANPLPPWLSVLEIFLSFFLAISTIWLGFKLFSALFENYVLGATLENEDEINTELLT
ncbi:hypothetical protein IQ260_22395, partial [Leptolyngbya cf. ectocarpi LEGE 11479]